MTTIYTLMDQVLLSEDLIECGENLISFAEAAMKEKNRAKIVREYIHRLLTSNAIHMPLYGDKPDFCYLTGSNAVQKTLCLRTNPDLPPVKFIESIARLGQEFLDNHIKPSGSCVTEEFVRELISYLNNEFDFTRKIYGEYVPTIVLNNNSHKILNGFQPVSNTEKAEGPEYIFLYHTMYNTHYSPEYVLLHELGHIVQMRYGSVNRPPDSFGSILSDMGLKAPDATLCEIFADTFAIAVMHESPFDKYTPFTDFTPDIRQLNKDYINFLLK